MFPFAQKTLPGIHTPPARRRGQESYPAYPPLCYNGAAKMLPMIYRARYILPITSDPIECGEVLVEDGAIKAVGTGLSEALPEQPRRDLGSAVLLPGFVNAHTHLEYTFRLPPRDGLNLWDWIEATGFGLGRTPDPEVLAASAMFGAAQCALSGVTCAADSSYSGASAAAIDAVGIRGTVCREIFGQSLGEGYKNGLDRLLDELHEMRGRLSGRIRMGVSPHSVYTSNRELLELCAGLCDSAGIPVALHLAETRAEADYLTQGSGPLTDMRRKMGREPMGAGMRPVPYLRETGLLRKGVCLAHCVDVTPEEVEMIASSGAGVAHCPRSNAMLGAGIAPLPGLTAAGARVGIGTDSPASSLNLDFIEELRFALAIHRANAEDAGALMAKDVLRQATIGGAQALGMEREIGSLEAGKRADVVAIRLDPARAAADPHLAVLASAAKDVALVLVDGEPVVEKGGLTRVDMSDCESRLRAVSGR